MTELIGFLWSIVGFVVVIVMVAVMMGIFEVFKSFRRASELRKALAEANSVIMHEVDMGRYPYKLKVENGGKGLSYIQETLRDN